VAVRPGNVSLHGWQPVLVFDPADGDVIGRWLGRTIAGGDCAEEEKEKKKRRRRKEEEEKKKKKRRRKGDILLL
jgi:hypothetical protein